LRARVHFCAETGQIWLHEHRMLLVHAEAQARCARNSSTPWAWSARAAC
jgi:hypothetical protein